MKISLRHPHGAIVLFDFEAAFPSVSHVFLWKALESLGVPAPLINILRSFYTNNSHIIKVKGQRFRSITSRSGIRQGCPLSPLIFAIIADVLLRKLAKDFPDCMVRAFADDTAMTLADFHKHADAIMKVFRDYGAFSGLRLGMQKTAVIPLWKYNASSFNIFLRDTLPEWSRAQTADKGKYLGFVIGPGRGQHSWSTAVSKYKRRAQQWACLPIGLFRGCQC